MNEEKILVIIPTLNEELIIRKVISEIKVSFKNIDILVIDGYSYDKTFNEVKKEQVNIIQIDNKFGISLAIETGIMFASKNNYDFLVRVDGDGQHSAKDVRDLLEFAIKKKKGFNKLLNVFKQI